jgi:hypothetical protein
MVTDRLLNPVEHVPPLPLRTAAGSGRTKSARGTMNWEVLARRPLRGTAMKPAIAVPIAALLFALARPCCGQSNTATIDDLGLNIALEAFGGRVSGPTQKSNPDWDPSNLIDGFPVLRGTNSIPSYRGWRAETNTFPQELVFSFRDGLEATVAAVVVDSAAGDTSGRGDGRPKDVEIWATTSATPDNFTRYAAVSLPPVAMAHRIDLPRVRARHLKLIVSSTHGKGKCRDRRSADSRGQIGAFDSLRRAEELVASGPGRQRRAVYFTGARHGLESNRQHRLGFGPWPIRAGHTFHRNSRSPFAIIARPSSTASSCTR